MVFVNGQKFACATCIKGHRSTTCNHGERPLHEIKKKGRPSTQCPHCKELRKAKHVNARCICGREEAVANGLKRAKSLSHDGRLSVPAAIGGEELLRSVSSQGRSHQDCQDAHSSSGGRHSIMPSLTSFAPCAAFLIEDRAQSLRSRWAEKHTWWSMCPVQLSSTIT
ncbi:MAG: copper fist DNA binding domain-containing protein [Benniella sp.]|nr:MAG: copper fist DNA binding domain-containing protein [Benniella sp.]